MIRPVDVALNATGLINLNGSFIWTAPQLVLRSEDSLHKDTLLVFDNSTIAIDKQPSAVYYYLTDSKQQAGWKLSRRRLHWSTTPMLFQLERAGFAR